MKKGILYSLLGIFVVFTSCKHQEINYLKNIEEVALQTSLQNAKSTIQTGDQLTILISAKDMDVVKPFNQNYSSGEIVQYSLPSGNAVAQGQKAVSGPSYTVDSEGYIDFPVIGKVDAKGKTIEELKENLREALTKYVKNPIVNIKTSNYKVVVLGEVNKPGTYYIPDGDATLFSALGLAGDLTMYGIRKNVLIVRNIDGQVTKQILDLTDANFINSPYYHLKQNDVIYVSANETKQKTSRLDPNAGIYIAAAGIIVTILALVFKK